MTELAPSIPPELQRRRALAAERARRYRLGRRQAPGARLAPTPTHRRAVEDIGPAIDPGDPFKDDLMWTEAEWTRRLAGAQFSDVAAPRF